MAHTTSLLSHIRIVLVHTFHPGNIGASARAMRTMGIKDLRLINPRDFPSEEASKMAAGASSDVLDNAKTYSHLSEAIKGCSLVIGASARLRELALPCFDKGESMANAVIKEAATGGDIALVFGRERFGLTNEEIALCTHQLSFPTDPEYGILNLAQAVQIACYDVRTAWQKMDTTALTQASDGEKHPDVQQLEYFDALLHDRLTKSGFLNQPHARTEERLRALFRRAEPNQRELSILIGMVKALSGE
ncbi:tRNA (cytidine/uridine-2'-O-)-methyltransferase TrmJ [Halomonadaceae bacterium LMG 33818]|uniref:RNA methyltransferase n=1 Tax=Cernens ardua TaxID=3402176 RepID=UPI003EDC92B7